MASTSYGEALKTCMERTGKARNTNGTSSYGQALAEGSHARAGSFSREEPLTDRITRTEAPRISAQQPRTSVTAPTEPKEEPVTPPKPDSLVVRVLRFLVTPWD